jgi:hypothetical protein
MEESIKQFRLTKLLTADGKLLDVEGYAIIDNDGGLNVCNGVYDLHDNEYILGFNEFGNIFGVYGDKDGNILYEDGRKTGYNINNMYKSVSCLSVVR